MQRNFNYKFYFKCEYCDRCYTKSQDYSRHLAVHKTEFDCEHCGERFFNVFLLRRHITVKHEN